MYEIQPDNTLHLARCSNPLITFLQQHHRPGHIYEHLAARVIKRTGYSIPLLEPMKSEKEMRWAFARESLKRASDHQPRPLPSL
jgi:hypothetical protein